MKQKLNIQNSTETEVMVVDDCISAVLLSIYLLDAQWYDAFEKIVFQGNKSAIILV